MTHFTTKTFLATAAFALAGAAFAQGTPPNPNVANPAMGAGQQTQQGTPMGTTGTPTAAPASPAPMNSGATTTPSQAPTAPAAPAMRPARADRN